MEQTMNGLLIFSAVKLAGYGLFFFFLAKRAHKTKKPAWAVGALAKTILGMAIGLALVRLALVAGLGTPVAYGVSLPVRALEWCVLLYALRSWLLRTNKTQELVTYAAIGLLVSVLLDLPGFLGLISQTGFIC